MAPMSLGWISGVSALFAATYLPSVLAFQPSADYGQPANNLYNCSGTTPTSALTATNSADTLPQIQPLSSQGWEQWDFFMHGTFPMILRWSQGDQSQADATPANGKIEIAILGVNGTNVQTSVTGPLTYTTGDVNQVSIGNNTFKWDSDSLWYNMTLSADGYTLVMNTYSAILDTVHPDVEQTNGLLSSNGPALYGSVPVTRGQSVGYLLTPDHQNITIGGLLLLKHTFSQQALPSYVTKLSSAMIWGYSTKFYDSNLFYQVGQVDGTVHEVAYLSRAIAGSPVKSDFPSTWAMYAVADDPSAYTLGIDPTGETILSVLSGCSATNNTSYLFSASVGSVITQFTDLGGGKTTYYNLSEGITLAPYDGGVVNGTIAGMYQIYEAPA